MSELLRHSGPPAPTPTDPRARRAAEFLDRHGPRVLGGSPASLVEATIRGGSDLGRYALAARVDPTDPARVLDAGARLGEAQGTARPDDLRDLAEVLAIRPKSAADLERALELYRLAEAMQNHGQAPGRHRSLHAQLAVLLGGADQDAVDRIDPLPPVAAAIRAELAHPERGGDPEAFTAAFNAFAGWDDVTLDMDASLPLLDRLRGTARPSSAPEGPLVSVLMTCRDPGPELLTAVRSVTAQTWSSWELLLIDDASADPASAAVLDEAAAADPRIRLLRRPTRGGTYRARNDGLAAALGEFTTGLDSDDWAHPRWLERQSAALRADPRLVMTQSLGIRATADLRLVAAPRRRFGEPRSTSMMFRTDEVRERFGGFDAVFKGGDSELRMRIQKSLGSRRWRLDQVNDTIVRQRRASLSHGEVGEGWMHPLRTVYESSFTRWHRRVQAKEARPFMPPEGTGPRPFPAPRELLERAAPPREYDRVHVGDWRYDGPTQRAMLAAAARDRRRGLAVAVAHVASWFALEERNLVLAPEAVDAVAAAGLDWVDPRSARSAETIAMDASIAADLEAAQDGPEPGSVAVLGAPGFVARRADELRRIRRAAGTGSSGLRRLPRRLLRGRRAQLRRLTGRAKRRLAGLVRGPDRNTVPPAVHEAIELWRSRLHGGWSVSAAAALTAIADDPGAHPSARIAALRALTDWHEDDHQRHQRRRDLDLDVVLVSNFSMPGGTTSSNVEEIRAFRAAGLTVGLLHHRVYDWPLDRPLSPKIAELVDGEQVVVLDAHDTVRCGLAIVRFPRIMMRPMEDLPDLTAERTVLVVNQPPYEYYGPEQGRVLTWDVRTVHEHLTALFGDHTWYAQGPVVRDAFATDHQGEFDDIDLADDYWYGVVDPEEWRRPGGPRREGPIRIGRHARDHVRKWPETVEDLLACYPEDDDFAIHVLGGSRAVRGLLGTLPRNWTVHQFGSIPPKEFLHGLDVLVFFIAESGQEAFGRTPLEAMAVGLPCILPPSFRPLYGDGALYCEPSEVAGVVRRLMDDPEAYRRQSELALARVRDDFSHAVLIDRVRRLGVGAARHETAAA
jgi:hypothetical protein